MKEMHFPLSIVPPGREVTLVAINAGWGLRRKINDMGLNEGMRLRVIHSHRPGPCIILVGNTRLALGHGIAQKILVKEE